jgi:putative phage-type endonuclease
MNARAEWLEARKQGIGGSDVAAVLGLSPWKTPVDIWLDKTNQTPDAEPNEAMYWGTVLEDVVAAEYAKRNNVKVQRITESLVHPLYPWARASIDRAVITPGSRARFANGELLGTEGLLECKTVNAYGAGDWIGEGELPVYYTAQVMWYMAITGAPWCDVAALIGGNKYVQKRIHRDADTCASLLHQVGEWWQRHVVEGVQPEPTNGADVSKLYPQDTGTSIEATADLLPLINRAREIKAHGKELDTELAQITDHIKVAMCDAQAVTVQGAPVLTWKTSKASTSIDWQNVAIDMNNQLAALGEGHHLYQYAEQNYSVTKKAARPFIIK